MSATKMDLAVLVVVLGVGVTAGPDVQIGLVTVGKELAPLGVGIPKADPVPPVRGEGGAVDLQGRAVPDVREGDVVSCPALDEARGVEEGDVHDLPNKVSDAVIGVHSEGPRRSPPHDGVVHLPPAVGRRAKVLQDDDGVVLGGRRREGDDDGDEEEGDEDGGVHCYHVVLYYGKWQRRVRKGLVCVCVCLGGWVGYCASHHSSCESSFP
jgi:hypothetical protein